MHHGDAILVVNERLKVQPLNQLLSVRSLENVMEIVFATGFSRSCRYSHQVKVMVAQHHRGAIPVGEEPPKGVEVARSAVDQIAHAPKAVFVRVELDLLQQVLEGFEASLNVANDEGAHARARDRKSRCVGFFLCVFIGRLMLKSFIHLKLG